MMINDRDSSSAGRSIRLSAQQLSSDRDGMNYVPSPGLAGSGEDEMIMAGEAIR